MIENVELPERNEFFSITRSYFDRKLLDMGNGFLISYTNSYNNQFSHEFEIIFNKGVLFSQETDMEFCLSLKTIINDRFDATDRDRKIKKEKEEEIKTKQIKEKEKLARQILVSEAITSLA